MREDLNYYDLDEILMTNDISDSLRGLSALDGGHIEIVSAYIIKQHLTKSEANEDYFDDVEKKVLNFAYIDALRRTT